jgi:NitT/TauT family transport system substrate-binding protein
VWTLQPFLGLLLEQGHRVVSYPSVEAIPGQPALVTFAARDYADENPEVVAGFHDGVLESIAYCEANPDDYKDAIVRYVEMPADVVAAIPAENWTPEIDLDLLQQVADQMLTYGVIDDELDVAELVFSAE